MQRPEFPRLSVNSSLKRTNKERSGASIGFIALVKYLLLTAHFPVFWNLLKAQHTLESQ